jgi:hypothetical protein
MKADTLLTSSIPEFTGNSYDFSATYPLPSVTIGTFTYTIPAGDHIVSASVAGSFGNSSANSTALSDYYVAGINVASCSSFSDPCFDPADPFDPPELWSYNFTAAQFAALTGGSAGYTVDQNSPFEVESGVTTLDVVVTPEPSSFVLLGGALVGLGYLLRKRLRNRRKAMALLCVALPALLVSPRIQAQVTWSASTAPVQTTIAGGPWTLAEGGPVTPVTATDYCVGTPPAPLVNASSVVNTMSPFYFPFVVGTGANLQGYFDYRPRNINEATVAANSTDGGLTWHFQQQVEQLTGGCPSSNTNSGGNDSGAGHPSILSFGGATWLYSLDRRGGHVDSDGLLVRVLSPRTSQPLNPLPLNAFTVPPTASTIARWDFSNYAAGVVINSPLPVIGTGTATVLGMNNSYTCSQTAPNVGSTTNADIIATGGSSNPASANAWRVRGLGSGHTYPCNGWSYYAPPDTQGVEFDVSTVGHTNVVFQYDWYSTNQGVRDLQAQYTTDGTHWNNVGALQIATPSGWNNQITINFAALGITGVDNNAHFGVRLVSVPDPTFTGLYRPAHTDTRVQPSPLTASRRSTTTTREIGDSARSTCFPAPPSRIRS